MLPLSGLVSQCAARTHKASLRSNRGRATSYVAVLGSPLRGTHVTFPESAPHKQESSCNYRRPRKCCRTRPDTRHMRAHSNEAGQPLGWQGIRNVPNSKAQNSVPERSEHTVIRSSVPYTVGISHTVQYVVPSPTIQYILRVVRAAGGGRPSTPTSSIRVSILYGWPTRVLLLNGCRTLLPLLLPDPVHAAALRLPRPYRV